MDVKNKVKIGVIGLGHRGCSLIRTVLSVEDVEILAVCDLYEERLADGVKWVQERGGNTPDTYTDYHQLLAREDITAVIVSTTWITHAKIAADAMRAGKKVGVEVGGAASVEECWGLVRAYEETGNFCMLLENVCYGKDELAVFNMARQGLFGEIIHAAGGYEHDLRDEIALGREQKHGRLVNFMNRNGDVYPTHQLGPIAKLLRINRGNRMLTLTSMSSKARGLHEWIVENKGEDYDLSGVEFTQGDITTTMIKCAHGETINLIHDCTLPRPYSRNGRVQGTRGIWMEDGNHIYIEGLSSKAHAWESFDEYREKYMHPLWKSYIKEGIKEGHDGIDYLVLSAFIDSVKKDAEPPIDVYDAATYMAITYLSEQSIAMGSMPVPIPDFTKGMWIQREPFRRGKYCLEEVCEEFFED